MNKIYLFVFALIISISAWANNDWVTDTKKGCKSSEICAVGTGDSRTASERNARLALGKIFDTKISSKLSSSLKSSGGNVEDALSEDIEELTESALAGVQITKNFEDKTSFYSLAVLNKSKAASGFKKEIEDLDGQMTVIFKDGNEVEKIKLGKIFVKREVLNKQYHFLTDNSIQSPVSFEEIFSAKKNASNDVVIHVYLDEAEPKTVEAALAAEVTAMGFLTTTGQVRNKNSTHIITGEFVPEKQYMQVEGFEKYKFILKVRAMKAGTKIETGHFNFEDIETGRNLDQATEKALPKIKDFIKQHIGDLSL